MAAGGHDERVLRVTLTEQGRALREQAVSVPTTIMATLQMDADQLRGLHAVLTEVIAHAEGAVGRPPARKPGGPELEPGP